MRWLEGQSLGWDFGAMHRWWDYPHGAYNGIQHIRWRRKWQPTPVFLPGEFHGQGSLVDYSPWDCRIGHDWAHSIQHIRQRQRYGQWELEWLERRWRVRRDVLQIEKAGAGGPVERELPMADCTESQERVTAVKNEDIIDGITLLYKHSGHISPVPISWGVKVEMVGWHHRPDGREFEQTPGVGDGQGGLVCCSPWGHKESDMTEWLNWTELKSKGNWLKAASADDFFTNLDDKERDEVKEN